MIPPDWPGGVARLTTLPAPPGYPRDRWAQFALDAAELVRTWGERLADLKWTTVDLFGLHRSAPFVRVDCMGLAPLLKGARMFEVDRQVARFEIREGVQHIYMRAAMPEAVPAWEVEGIR